MALHRTLLTASTPCPSDLSSDGWHLIHGADHGPIQLPATWPSLWLPVQGRLQMHAPDAEWVLRAGGAQLWRGGPMRVEPSSDAQWRCLTAPLNEWAQRFAGHDGDEPLPWYGEADGSLRLALDALAERSHEADASLDRLVATLVERQREAAAYLPRCRGRTLQHRRQALLRLLHLHHLMRCRLEDDDEAAIDVAWLAERAHYSPGHLIRLHRDVFGETPGEYFSRLRDARAWQLVRETDLPVVAITHKLGFESQSAFCRAFKHAFGMTATQARRENAECAAA